MKNEQKAANKLQYDERIERYIFNKMSDSEAEEFEAYFLSNSACLEHLEVAEKIHQGLQSLHADSDMQNVAESIPQKQPVWHKRVPVWLLAAAILIALVIPRVDRLFQPISEPSGVQVFNIELAATRADDAKAIELNVTDSQALLSFYVDTEIARFDHKEYGFRLLNAENEVVFNASNLKLNNASTLFVNLGHNLVPPGLYTFEVYGGTQSNRLLMQSGRMHLKIN
ncbi:MAG: hypothetical protein HWE26_20045 [Alteromonadaceae bacterium]|nr:hypothetical protein [Alteromonadaceae bacterium]